MPLTPASQRHPDVPGQLRALLRGQAEVIAAWLRAAAGQGNRIGLWVGVIVLGCGCYGFTLGLWRAPLQGAYVAVKLPALILLTLAANGLLNGMFGSLLGSGLSFRQTLNACLMSFATFAMIVGSLSPVMLGMVLDAPAPHEPGAERWYRVFLLTNTAVITFAGIVANVKLLRLLEHFSRSRQAAWRTLLAWLAGNLFAGAQLSYNLRPFFGNPDLPVQFLRPNPFGGTFYEAVWQLTLASLPREQSNALLLLLAVLVVLGCLIIWFYRREARRMF